MIMAIYKEGEDSVFPELDEAGSGDDGAGKSSVNTLWSLSRCE